MVLIIHCFFDATNKVEAFERRQRLFHVQNWLTNLKEGPGPKHSTLGATSILFFIPVAVAESNIHTLDVENRWKDIGDSFRGAPR